MKKLLLASILSVTIFGLSGCSSDIDRVKDSVLDFNSAMTLGDALDNYKYCQDSEWTSYTTEKNEDIVKFSCKLTLPLSEPMAFKLGEEAFNLVRIAKNSFDADDKVAVPSFVTEAYRKLNGYDLLRRYQERAEDLARNCSGRDDCKNFMTLYDDPTSAAKSDRKVAVETVEKIEKQAGKTLTFQSVYEYYSKLSKEELQEQKDGFLASYSYVLNKALYKHEILPYNISGNFELYFILNKDDDGYKILDTVVTLVADGEDLGEVTFPWMFGMENLVSLRSVYADIGMEIDEKKFDEAYDNWMAKKIYKMMTKEQAEFFDGIL